MARRYGVAVYLLVLIAAAALAEATQEATHESVGVGRGLLIPGDRENPCPGSDLLVNADGSYENGYAWQYGGVVPPYYGAFAEGYTATGTVCGVSYKLTTLLSWYATMDCYLWDSDGWNPRNVLAVVYDFYPGAPAIWPNVSAHDLGIPDTDIDGGFFVGYWPTPAGTAIPDAARPAARRGRLSWRGRLPKVAGRARRRSRRRLPVFAHRPEPFPATPGRRAPRSGRVGEACPDRAETRSPRLAETI